MCKKAKPGTWLKKKRAEHELTQEQLAQLTGLTIRDVRRIEANDLKLGCSKLIALANYFDVTVEEVLYGEADVE